MPKDIQMKIGLNFLESIQIFIVQPEIWIPSCEFSGGRQKECELSEDEEMKKWSSEKSIRWSSARL